MLITSINNEKIKNLSKLNIKKYRDEEKKFLVEGDHLVSEAIKTNNLLELFVLEGKEYNFPNIPLTYVTKEVLKKLSEQDSSTDIIGVCSYINNNDLSDKLIIFDGLQDPGNVGTIIRSAAAFGYSVILGDNTVDIYNSKTIRSTEGMLFNVSFLKTNIKEFINSHDEYKYLIADMHKGCSSKELKNINKPAIIVGNEGNGISGDLRNMNIDYVHINQNDKCESLNVGVAASILMYELGDIHE